MDVVIPTTTAAAAPTQQIETAGVEEAFEREAGRLEAKPSRDERKGGDEQGAEPAMPPTAWPWQAPLPAALRLKQGGRRAGETPAQQRGEVGKAAGLAHRDDGRRGQSGASALSMPAPHAASGAARLPLRLQEVVAATAAETMPISTPARDKAKPAGHSPAPAAAEPRTEAQPAWPQQREGLEPLLREHLRATAPQAGETAPAPARPPRKPETDAAPAGQAAAPVRAEAARVDASPLPAEAPRQAKPQSQPAPAAPQTAPAPEASGLTYRFQSWGAGHAVTVQASPGATQLTLQPSDNLVQQRLSEQWQSGNPQQWNLAGDGRDGGGRDQRRQHDEEEEA
ncbi:type III secretion system needle length determinant, SpaN/EivJ family [Chromobacterium vaccinii]|uniref:SpaN/EivJ family type III secretion system needle length determinant n=1 Tax=Chromobacterium vaccinii TaxID=1108595 RepID=UPI003C78C4C9